MRQETNFRTICPRQKYEDKLPELPSSEFRRTKANLQTDSRFLTIISQEFACLRVLTDRKERRIPNKLRLRRGGGGGVGGCGVFAPRREISTSTRETVSPEARKATRGREERKKVEKGEREVKRRVQWGRATRRHRSRAGRDPPQSLRQRKSVPFLKSVTLQIHGVPQSGRVMKETDSKLTPRRLLRR